MAGSLASNLAPMGATRQFDDLASLTADGQLFANLLSMSALGDAIVVYGADVSSIGAVASGWQMSFAAGTFGLSDTTSVDVEFSTDRVPFTALPSITFGGADGLFVATRGGTSSQAFFRLSFEGGGPQEIIDNVAIQASEITIAPGPGTGVLFLLGGVGTFAIQRRRW